MNKGKYHIILAVVLLITVCFNSNAYAGQTIEDGVNLNYRLYRFDDTNHNYLPYIPAVNRSAANIVFPVIRSEFPAAFLSIRLPENSHLFLNGKYFYTASHQAQKLVDLDSLFRTTEDDTLFLGMYFPGKNAYLANVTLIPKGGNTYTGQIGENRRIRAGFTAFNNFLITGFLILTGFMAFLLNYDRKLFGQYVNVVKIFSNPGADDLLDRNKPVAGTDLMFVILEALAFGFFIYIIFYGSRGDKKFMAHGFVESVLYWILLSSIVLVWILIKFNFVKNLSYVLQIKEVGKVHFIESSRITLFLLIVYLVLSLVLLYGMKIDISSLIPFLIGSLIYAAVFRFLLIVIKILNYTSYKKMYIISYLCASELVPVVLGIKLILDSSLKTWII